MAAMISGARSIAYALHPGAGVSTPRRSSSVPIGPSSRIINPSVDRNAAVDARDRVRRARAGAPELQAHRRVRNRDQRRLDHHVLRGDLKELAAVGEAVDGAAPERDAEYVGVAERSVVLDHVARLRIDLKQAVRAARALHGEEGAA